MQVLEDTTYIETSDVLMLKFHKCMAFTDINIFNQI